MEAAHRSVGGTARGRRFATEQINHAYAVLLASQFQGFARDLHSECADRLAKAIAPTAAASKTARPFRCQIAQLDAHVDSAKARNLVVNDGVARPGLKLRTCPGIRHRQTSRAPRNLWNGLLRLLQVIR